MLLEASQRTAPTHSNSLLLFLILTVLLFLKLWILA